MRRLSGWHRTVVVAGAAALAVLVALPAAAIAGGPGPGSIPGTAPVVAKGSADLGPASPGGQMRVTVALALRDRSGLAALTSEIYDPQSAMYDRFLTPSGFEARFSPAARTVAAVSAWARGDGLSVVSVSPNRTLVDLQGTVAAVEHAFGTRIDRFGLPGGGTYLSPVATASLPPSFAPQVAAVLGLSTLGRVGASPVLPSKAGIAAEMGTAPAAATSVYYPNSYGPQDFWQIYDAGSTGGGTGQTIAVLAEGNLTQVLKDLRTFEAKFALPQVPVSVVKVDGGSTDTSGQDEFDLDTQYSTGFAPDVKQLVVYDGRSLSDSDIADEVNAWVSADVAPQASFSAGECESLAQVVGFQSALDNVLAQAVAQGQTLFTSSGDTGGTCSAVVGVNGVPAGQPGVNYPAASTGAVAVGGTTLFGGPGSLYEIAWYASGGGASLFEPEPAYQATVGGSNVGVSRDVPDVSLDADPNSGYDVFVSGQETVVGGTSASAPSWLGIWARAQQAHGGRLGFAGRVIYKVPASVFNQVTVGDNGIYPATPGYNEVTGRGTPDIAKFVAAA